MPLDPEFVAETRSWLLKAASEFMALPFRQKPEVIEQLGEVAAFFAARRRARGLPVKEQGETSSEHRSP